MKRENLRMMVEGSIMIALALVLGFLAKSLGLSLPQGGDISLASLPILVFALRHGYKWGVLVGLAYGLLNFLIDPYHVAHPVSIIFDYLLIGVLLGLIGLKGKDIIKYIIIYLAIYLSHVFSGIVVFASYAPEGMNVAAYSFIYNISYVGPEFIIVGIILVLLSKFTKILKKEEI
ncbi:MAG: energy-coupled thiamine transporter ThiT [Fusobacteria bacterium]|nr:energy-coupled thiamine transporter ThiT [Fusobacteriota bacterium]